MTKHQKSQPRYQPGTSVARLAMLVLTLVWETALAQPGAFDPTFSQDGKLVVSIDRDYGSALAIQPDGKIVAAGTTQEGDTWKFAVLRITEDGKLDSTFNSTGKLTFNMQNNSNGYTQADDIALQADGKILVCGLSDLGGGDGDWAILRLNPDGSPDNTFDGNGQLFLGITNNNSEDHAKAMVYDPVSHKITVAGDTPANIALVRLNPNGSLDNTFGNNGKVIAGIPNYSPNALGLVQMGDSIWVCGPAWYGFANSDGYVAKFTSSGDPDASFGTNGFAVFKQTGWQFRPYAMLRLPDGKLLVTGDAGHTSSDSSEIFLARLIQNGQPDPSFGDNGISILNISTRRDAARHILYDPMRQKVIVTGYSEKTGSRRLLLLRFNLNGTFDEEFGLNGIVITTPGTGWADGEGAALQADGKMLTIGHIFNGGSYDFAFTRHLLDGTNSTEKAPQTDRFSVSVQPNPVTNTFRLTYTLPESCRVSADVWDSFGRRVGQLLASEQRMAGMQSESFGSENLFPGFYVVRLQTSDGRLYLGSFVKSK